MRFEGSRHFYDYFQREGIYWFEEKDITEMFVALNIPKEAILKLIKQKELLAEMERCKDHVEREKDELLYSRKEMGRFISFKNSREGIITKELCEGNKKHLPELRGLIKKNNVFDMEIDSDEGYIGVYIFNDKAHYPSCEGEFDVDHDIAGYAKRILESKIRLRELIDVLKEDKKELAEIKEYLKGKEI